jgi:hypothetical protein
LDWLLASNFDPGVGYFTLSLWRREARDLRKGLFGPKGLRDVPKGEGVRRFDLPNGWTLCLKYDDPPEDWDEPADVIAEFIPPITRNVPPNSSPHPVRWLEGSLPVEAVGGPG